MTSNTPFILPAAEHYDGTNWLEFKTKIRAAAKQRGTLDYLDGKIKFPTESENYNRQTATPPTKKGEEPASSASDDKQHPRTTYWGSTNPSPEEWLQRDAWTQGLITLNVKNPVGLGVMMEGTAAETWASIAELKDAKSDLGCISAKLALTSIKYMEGTDMDEHLSKLRTAWAKANGQGADIGNVKFRMIILRSLPSTWLSFVGSLHNETSSADVINWITAHAMLVASHRPATSHTALATQYNSRGTSKNSHLKCTNPKCLRDGHAIETCFKEGGGQAGQYPDWWRKGGSGGGGGGRNNGGGTAIAALATTGAMLASSTCNTVEETYLAFSATLGDRNSAQIISYADSAASEHYFVDRSDFTNYTPITRSGEVATGIGFRILGTGTVVKQTWVDGKRYDITFHDALHAPDFSHNLILIGRMDQKGCTVRFGNSMARFEDRRGIEFMVGTGLGTMYRLDLLNPMYLANATLVARSLSKATDLEGWHRRLGHVAEATIRAMMKDEVVVGLSVTKTAVNGRCEDCIFGKQSRRPFDYEVVEDGVVLGMVYFDLWGPARTQSISGKSYMMMGTDRASKDCVVYFLAHKDKHTTFAALKHYVIHAETETGLKVKRIRTDNGLEFDNDLWAEFCEERGIVHEFTTPYSSQANGVAERGFRTVLNGTRTCLHDAGLPGSFWAEGAATFVYILNRVLQGHATKTPREIFTGKKPDVSHLRPFGCIAYAKIPDETNDGKLAPRSLKCVMLGYFGVGAWRLLDRVTGRIFKSRDVIFEEGRAHRTLDEEGGRDGGREVEEVDSGFEELDATESSADESDNLNIEQLGADDPAIGLTAAQNPPPAATTALVIDDTANGCPAPDVTPDPEPEVTAPRRSARWTSERLPDDVTIPKLACAAETRNEEWVPRNAREALASGDEGWKDAMDKEFKQMLKMGVWRLVERPEGAKLMKCGWVFVNKLDGDGNIISKKARIVAKGFSQIPGLHFFESFAAVVRYESVRINLAMAVARSMYIWQADYVSAYLNAPNQVPILMEQVEGFELTSLEGCTPTPPVQIPRPNGMVYELDAFVPPGGDVISWSEKALDADVPRIPPPDGKHDLVVVLDRTLYGTQDGACNWAAALNKEMESHGYYRSRADQSVRSRITGESEHTVTCTYSDDVNGMSTTKEGWATAIRELGEKFEIKDLGESKLMIGMTLERDWVNGTMKIHQRPFLERILKRFRMDQCAPKYTPLPAGIVLSKTQCPSTPAETAEMATKPYREGLGCVIFAANVTRIDILQAVTKLAQFASNPGLAHWNALLHLLAYIKATLHFSLTYGGKNHMDFTPVAYSDSDYAGDIDSRRSCSGYVCLQAGGPTAWSSKLQSTVALSTSEAEYIAMSRCAQQLEWMYASLSEVGLPQPRPAVMYADNTSAIFLANNSKHNARVKHIDVRHHYVRDRIESGDIAVKYVPSAENLADILTKPLGRVAHWKICAALRLYDVNDVTIESGGVLDGNSK